MVSGHLQNHFQTAALTRLTFTDAMAREENGRRWRQKMQRQKKHARSVEVPRKSDPYMRTGVQLHVGGFELWENNRNSNIRMLQNATTAIYGPGSLSYA